MELTGKLQGLELTDLLQMIGFGNKTATLLMRSQDEWIGLVFENGKLSLVLSQAVYYESFGELLIDIGILDESILPDVLMLQQLDKPQRRIGEIMKDYGLDTNSIKKLLFSQIRSLMAQLLMWDTSIFSLHLDYIPSLDLPNEIRQINLEQPINIIELLFLAGQEVDESKKEYFEGIKIPTPISVLRSKELEVLLADLAFTTNDKNLIKNQYSYLQSLMLYSAMVELHKCHSQEEILMTLLKTSGVFAGRGLLIKVEENILYNLGHYNSTTNFENKEEADVEKVLSVDANSLNVSVLGRVRQVKQPILINWSELLADNKVDNWLLSGLGTRWPNEPQAFLIAVHSETSMLVLYGDDLNRPIGFNLLAELETLLIQASLMIEYFHLENSYNKVLQSFCNISSFIGSNNSEEKQPECLVYEKG